jgi:hypothetical protein
LRISQFSLMPNAKDYHHIRMGRESVECNEAGLAPRDYEFSKAMLD